MTDDLYNSAALNKKIASDEITKLTEIKTIIEETEPIKHKSSNDDSLKGLSLNRTRHHWTEEEEFNLICNFYELSIDEVRNEFQRPFYAIAKRLEMIVDSTEPKYIDMLMAASKIIKERKQVRDKATKTGFLKRRKLRRQAMKVAKLEKKLNKMRGE